MKMTFLISRKEVETSSVILAAIRYKNYRINYSTGVSVPPEFWDSANRKVRESKYFPEYRTFNQRLIKFRAKVTDRFYQFLNENDEMIPDPREFKQLLDVVFKRNNQKVKKYYTFLEYLQEIIDQSKSGIRIHPKTGKPISEQTIKTYATTQKHLTEFSKVKKRELQFDDIDLDFYEDYKAYLIRKKLLSNNTVGKHIQIIKLVMNEANERGITSNLKHKSKRFFVIKENTDNIFLNENEIVQIARKDFSGKRNLEITRDLFVVGCMTGLRYSDFSNLQPEQIKNGFINVTQDKTGGQVVIPVHPLVRQFLAKYNDKLPKAYCNQKTNQYLKQIGEEIECLNIPVSKEYTKGGQTIISNSKKWELITTHTARRSFATNEIKKGTPVLVVMAITGHKTEKAFWGYIKLAKSDYAVMLKDIWDKRNKKSKLKAV